MKAVKISRCGMLGANGVYVKRGAAFVLREFELRGGVDLSKQLGAPFKSAWVLQSRGSHLYVNASTAKDPPSKEWLTVGGLDPVPSLSPCDPSEAGTPAPASAVPPTGAGPVAPFQRRYRKRRLEVGTLLADWRTYMGQTVELRGWCEQFRNQKEVVFLHLNDGSSFRSVQAVQQKSVLSPESLKAADAANKGASVVIKGKVVESPGQKQDFEVHMEDIQLLGPVDPNSAFGNLLRSKQVKMDTLRSSSYCHLRCRTRTFRAVFGVRNTLAAATHEFFQSHGMKYIHTPCLTASDCEGAGETFVVSNVVAQGKKLAELPTKDGTLDLEKDFFGKEVNLTVSGQLHVECFSSSVSDVYTFGPTFRAEHSNTSRHLAEFWMIEPEISFATLEDDMNLAEDYVKYCVGATLSRHPDELKFLQELTGGEGLLARLTNILESPFERLSYTEAIALLEEHIKTYKIAVQPANWSKMTDKEKKKWTKKESKRAHIFENPVSWGIDMASEHEKYLTDVVFKKPVIVYNYPLEIKAFYMKQNSDEEPGRETVQAMDILVPGIGELIGGSAREDDFGRLEARIRANGIDPKAMDWYLDLRKYGSVPHAGFGLGFERLVMLCTAIENIRDVIPFPRAYGLEMAY